PEQTEFPPPVVGNSNCTDDSWHGRRTPNPAIYQDSQQAHKDCGNDRYHQPGVSSYIRKDQNGGFFLRNLAVHRGLVLLLFGNRIIDSFDVSDKSVSPLRQSLDKTRILNGIA